MNYTNDDILKKIKKAAALKYDAEKDAAPRVTALGEGESAQKMLELAREHNIPIYKDPALAEALVKLDIGQEIPPELYRAAAEILAFIYSLEEQD
ncbi:MAG: flagellar biosynthesis protein [Thermoanaerobacteraceae bacterium]|nr:flagellar biosynthesis protein [Thermoanaerobacteraceae bacterium]MDN5311251.1 flagellar biosynthesis protein [Thermoanaerobacteraceae bacterium]RKL61570.1 flagellar biosynthesis [Thermoanaerobacteraceae bacterium SP2]